MLRSSIIGLLGALALTGSVAAAPKTPSPGSTVGELIALARQLSPELAAAALSSRNRHLTNQTPRPIFRPRRACPCASDGRY